MTLLHVLTVADWTRLQADGTWPPSPFFHLCTEAQLPSSWPATFPAPVRLPSSTSIQPGSAP